MGKGTDLLNVLALLFAAQSLLSLLLHQSEREEVSQDAKL